MIYLIVPHLLNPDPSYLPTVISEATASFLSILSQSLFIFLLSLLVFLYLSLSLFLSLSFYYFLLLSLFLPLNHPSVFIPVSLPLLGWILTDPMRRQGSEGREECRRHVS